MLLWLWLLLLLLFNSNKLRLLGNKWLWLKWLDALKSELGHLDLWLQLGWYQLWLRGWHLLLRLLLIEEQGLLGLLRALR